MTEEVFWANSFRTTGISVSSATKLPVCVTQPFESSSVLVGYRPGSRLGEELLLCLAGRRRRPASGTPPSVLQVVKPGEVCVLESLVLENHPLEDHPAQSFLSDCVWIMLQELALAPVSPDGERVLPIDACYRAANTGPVDGASGVTAGTDTAWAIEFPNTSWWAFKICWSGTISCSK